MAFKMRSGNKPTFKNMGSTNLPGINQRGNENMADGRSNSSAFQKTGGESPMKVVPLAAAGLTAVRALATRGARKVAKKQLPKVAKKLSKTKGGQKVIEKLNVGKTWLQKGKDFLKSKAGKTAMITTTAGVPALMGSKKAPAEKKQTPVNEANRKTKPGEKVKGGTKTWKEGSKAAGGNLNTWVKERGKHKKGSAEYNALQNKINKALGSKKRHGETTSTKTSGPKVNKDTKRTTKTTTGTPGIGTKTTKVVKGTKGDVKKTKTWDRDVKGDLTQKTKTKGDKTKITDYTPTDVTKTKTKGSKRKVKTRKRGGTGLGAAIKGAVAKRKARREERRNR